MVTAPGTTGRWRYEQDNNSAHQEGGLNTDVEGKKDNEEVWLAGDQRGSFEEKTRRRMEDGRHGRRRSSHTVLNISPADVEAHRRGTLPASSAR